MLSYRITVYFNYESESVCVQKSEPLSDREAKEYVKSIVQDLIASGSLDPIGSVEWEVESLIVVSSGTLEY